MRVAHYLKHNANSESPTNVLVVDTEAKITKKNDGSEEQVFRLGYAIRLFRDNNGWHETGYELHSVDDFWTLLDRFAHEANKKKRLYIYAHNMKYDYTILKIDSYLSSRNMEITLRVLDGIFLIKSENMLFLSSTNYYRNKLEELGRIFGLSKMESPDFYDSTDAELMPYCQRDTQVLATIILQHIEFIKKNDLGTYKPTIAGQSFVAFRHKFMRHKLLIHNHQEIIDLEQKSYRGGRNEAFKLGKFEKIYKLDINSMYPFVMKNRKYPTMPMSNDPIDSPEINLMEKAISDGLFILAECDLELKKPVIACKRDKLIFPVGRITQVITSPEIDYILQNPECGRIIKVKRMVVYRCEFIFSEYVDFFYNLRLSTKNEAIKAMCKVLLNALYGKFGQRKSGECELITDKNLITEYESVMKEEKTGEIWTDIGCKVVKVGDKLYNITKISGEYSRDSIPIIASAVTAYARDLLQRLIDKAGIENVIYCDTDSLFVNQSGYDRLNDAGEIHQNQLGKMKLEEVGDVEIKGLKDYVFNGSIKLKGIKKNAKKISENSYQQMQFQTGHIRYAKGTPDGIVLLKPVTKKISREYNKGMVKGGVISPYLFSEWSEPLSIVSPIPKQEQGHT